MQKRLWQAMVLILTQCFLALAPQVAKAEIAFSIYNEEPVVSNQDTLVNRPLIVWIHGCNQQVNNFVAITNIVEKTKHLNPVIIAPFQKDTMTMLKCWNFLSDEMTKRDGKYLQAITKEVQKHIDSGLVDPNRVFVGGFSSGAAYAGHLALCFPDMFKGALLHSGSVFDSSEGMISRSGLRKGALKALACASESKSPRRLKNLLYVHGKKDLVLPYALSFKAFAQAVHYMDYLDDSLPNQSYDVKREQHKDKFDFSAKFADGTALEFILVENMSHRWSGSLPGAGFSSPETISSVDTFLNMTNQLQ